MEVRDILDPNPVLSHRFGVLFLAGGSVPNPLDFRFQRVSGLSREVQLETVYEGGQNLHGYSLPKRITSNNLVLERGYTLGSPLRIELGVTFSQFKFYPSNVLITLFEAQKELGDKAVIPVAAWLFMKAYPVKWNIADLDAQSNTVLIESIELAYSELKSIQV